ncbi:response regulator [Archaeoglobus neptunius]|uniref:response regulator n=1 Tax=Archaeoglobus neptunius TaxID=2798580 RepID=UPI00192827A4|nr:response regulator [Archaeoglobus neptunius]
MKKRVLIVDNDRAVVEAFKDLLSEGYDVAIASDGKEGIEAFRTFKPDLVIVNMLMPSVEGVEVDIPLPLMNGVEFTREIKRIDPDIKVIGISAFAAHRGDELLEAGAEDVVKKPLSKDELISIIERHIH